MNSRLVAAVALLILAFAPLSSSLSLKEVAANPIMPEESVTPYTSADNSLDENFTSAYSNSQITK